MNARSLNMLRFALAPLLLVGLFMLSPSAALAQSIIYCEIFEDGASDWFPDNGVWQVGDATVGPTDSGTVAGTILDGNYPFQTYSRVIGPWITLPASPQDGMLWLRFAQWFNIHTSDGIDYGRVQIAVDSDPNSWTNLSGSMTAWSPYWTQCMADLADYAGQTIRIGFLFDDQDGSGPSHYESHGWYIDDVCILEGRFVDRSLYTFDDSVEGDWEGWYAENGCWDIGQPSPNLVAPHSRRRCAGTNLHGNYSYQANSRLISPPLDLPASPEDGQIWLSYWSLSSIHYADGTDYGQVEIQIDGGAWEVLPNSAVRYWAGCWSPCAIDISAYAGERVRVAFRLVDVDGSGPSHYEGPGWFVDDVAIRYGRQWLNNVERCEGTITGWAATAGLWQLGAPTSGPGAAYSGESCWATNLAGNYGLYSRSSLLSVPIELPAAPTVQLTFQHWFSFSTSDGTDKGYVYVHHAAGDSLMGELSASSGDWTPYNVDLSSFAGQTIRISFSIVDTDGSGPSHYEAPGWYIDDLTFTGLDTSSPASPVLVGVDWSTSAPVVNFFADAATYDKVCVYASKDSDDIVNLSNRVAVLPAAGLGSFTDLERPGWGQYYYSVTGVDAMGHESAPAGPYLSAVGDGFDLPAHSVLALHGSHPNPFNPKTEISFTLARPAHVVLEVFDLRGRLVARLLDEPVPAGSHAVPFEDRRLASGVYMARIRAGDELRTCKMMMVK